MPDNAMMRELFDRWERVWHEAQYGLIPICVGSHYIRHDEQGDRTVTREAYAAELAGVHKDRPSIRVVVYDHSFTDDRAWFRFTFQWLELKTGEKQSRAGMQSYRIEGDKLVETWITMRPFGTSWTDVAQEKLDEPEEVKPPFGSHGRVSPIDLSPNSLTVSVRSSR